VPTVAAQSRRSGTVAVAGQAPEGLPADSAVDLADGLWGLGQCPGSLGDQLGDSAGL
jgi:hypothetical protein